VALSLGSPAGNLVKQFSGAPTKHNARATMQRAQLIAGSLGLQATTTTRPQNRAGTARKQTKSPKKATKNNVEDPEKIIPNHYRVSRNPVVIWGRREGVQSPARSLSWGTLALPTVPVGGDPLPKFSAAPGPIKEHKLHLQLQATTTIKMQNVHTPLTKRH